METFHLETWKENVSVLHTYVMLIQQCDIIPSETDMLLLLLVNQNRDSLWSPPWMGVIKRKTHSIWVKIQIKRWMQYFIYKMHCICIVRRVQNKYTVQCNTTQSCNRWIIPFVKPMQIEELTESTDSIISHDFKYQWAIHLIFIKVFTHLFVNWLACLH